MFLLDVCPTWTLWGFFGWSCIHNTNLGVHKAELTENKRA
jgi:hypothetical protein